MLQDLKTVGPVGMKFCMSIWSGCGMVNIYSNFELLYFCLFIFFCLCIITVRELLDRLVKKLACTLVVGVGWLLHN